MRRDIGTLVKAAFAATSLVAGILQLSAGSAAADQIGFAVDGTGTLFNVDLTTATAAPIGPTGQFLEGLTVSPSGSLFGTDNLSNLFSISKTTGAATLIGNTGILNNGSPDIEGLTFRGSTLIGTDFSNLGGPTTIYAISTTNAASSPIISFTQGPVRAMALLNTNTIDVASDSPVSQSLLQVNLLNGTNTNLGQLPSSGAALIAAMNFGTDGNLYALDPFGNDYMIASNGAGILIGNTGGQYWTDLAMASTALDPAPVPKLSTIGSLLIAALVIIGVWDRSRGATQG